MSPLIRSRLRVQHGSHDRYEVDSEVVIARPLRLAERPWHSDQQIRTGKPLQKGNRIGPTGKRLYQREPERISKVTRSLHETESRGADVGVIAGRARCQNGGGVGPARVALGLMEVNRIDSVTG